jgi:hypothetical protein
MSLLSEDKDQLIRLILNWATEELPSPLLPPLDLPCSFFFEPQNANFDVILDRETEEFSSHLFKSVQEFISKYLPSFNEINTTIQSYEELTIQTKNNEQPQHQPQQQQQQQHTTNDEVYDCSFQIHTIRCREKRKRRREVKGQVSTCHLVMMYKRVNP